MNFIDKALEEITNGEDFVQAMAEIYEHTEVREKLDKFPAWIRNIITVIDYDTELSMNGFRINHKVIFDYLFKSSYMPV